MEDLSLGSQVKMMHISLRTGDSALRSGVVGEFSFDHSNTKGSAHSVGSVRLNQTSQETASSVSHVHVQCAVWKLETTHHGGIFTQIALNGLR